MKCTGAIEGIIKNAAGTPISDVNVVIVFGSNHSDIAAITDVDGTFAFGDLQPGMYGLMAFGNNVESDRISVQVLAGKVAFVEICLEADTIDERDEVVDEIS